METAHTQYSTWSPPADQSVRNRLRHLALNALSAGDHSLPSEPHVQFLYIHHVFDDEQKGLRSLLNSLGKHYTFISHSEGVRKIQTGEIDAPYLAFSSDDGFLNNLNAATIFKEFDISACFFLNPNTIGLSNSYEIQTFCRTRLNSRPVQFLNWKEVEKIQGQGHEVGSHSLAHFNLSSLAPAEIQQDLAQSKAILEQHCGTVNHFAYPYGRWSDFNQIGFKTSLAAGYSSCATAERGCHVNTEPLDLSHNLLLRDQVILGWPESHIRYFIRRNFRRGPQSTNNLPKQ